MREILQPGFRVSMSIGGEAIIGKHIASDGRSDIYTIFCQGQEKILKWYGPDRPHGDPKRSSSDIVMEKILRLQPSPEILSPIDMVAQADGMFGYVLEPIPPEYKRFSDYLLRKERMVSFVATVDAALHIVATFHALHSSGFCLQDATIENIWIESRTGRALLFDDDAITICGADMQIMSHPRYTAPEVVFERKPPDARSDRYTIAVFLFILFCGNHPLEGKRSLVPVLTPEIQEKLYGGKALFIMDPNDTSNAPDPVIHRKALAVWSRLPDYMQEIFLKAFSKNAIANPGDRPTEREWLQALARLRNDIVPCVCGNEITI